MCSAIPVSLSQGMTVERCLSKPSTIFAASAKSCAVCATSFRLAWKNSSFLARFCSLLTSRPFALTSKYRCHSPTLKKRWQARLHSYSLLAVWGCFARTSPPLFWTLTQPCSSLQCFCIPHAVRHMYSQGSPWSSLPMHFRPSKEIGKVSMAG